MTKNIPKRNHWNWGISVKPKRTNSIMIVRFVSVIFKWSSLSKFTFLGCIFFLHNWTKTWALVLISSLVLSYTLVFCDLGRFDLKSGAINSSAEKNLKWFIMLHLHSNKIHTSHHFNLNYGEMENEESRKTTTYSQTVN